MNSKPTPRVLVVDDSQSIRGKLAGGLAQRGFEVDTAEDGRSALALIEAGAAPDLVLLDVSMPAPDGLATLERIRSEHPGVQVLMLSADARASTIVEAIRRGAADYLNKPPDLDQLEAALRSLLTDRERNRRHEAIRAKPHSDAIWEGPSLGPIYRTIEQIADTDVTVLIQGESGVGKEVVARKVHSSSARAKAAFVKVNCAALPGELLESELFGYEQGAFTGATARKPGKFDLADGGTIFLDEIGEMSPTAQAKMLQVLQDGSFHRLGGNHEIQADVRIVTATNRPLDEEVAKGRFREDLFFRLNVVGLHIPPLRDRREELPGLVTHLLERAVARYRRAVPELSRSLFALFEQYEFPGNVRELENYLKRIVVLGSEDVVIAELHAKLDADSAPTDFDDLLAEVEETAGEVPLREVGRRAAQAAESVAIRHALRRTQWNRRRAAEILGVSYKTLLAKIRASGLHPESDAGFSDLA